MSRKKTRNETAPVSHPSAPPRRGRGAGRRLGVGLALVFLLVAGLGWSLWRGLPSSTRREGGLSVLLVTIDTLRADALGVYGQRRPTSPWIDRLAGAGVRFQTAYAHHVVTLPSHANILSGLYGFEHGVRDNAGFRFPGTIETMAHRLKAHGYRTAAFVSGFPLDSRFGLDQGFDAYDDSFGDAHAAGVFMLPERPAAQTVPLAQRWIEGGGKAPYFCWIHLYDPHAPYLPPEPFASSFGDAPYLGEVAATDAALRPILEPLLREGRRGRTLVVLTADHGESLGEHGERTHGLFAYEATLRVPLVLFSPRLLDPRVVAEPVRHVDIIPTILDALALPVPGPLPGRSLLALASGRGAPPAPSYFEALSGMLGRGWAPLYGVVRANHKFVDLPIPELYDLETDPREEHNVVASRPQVLETLAGLLREFRAADKGIARADETADTRERLAALGYVTAAAAPLKKHYGKEDDPKRLVYLDEMMQQVIALHRAGELQSALALCQEVVRRRPQMAAGLLQLALLERKLGRLGSAVEALEKAVALNPEDLSAVVLLGSYLSEAGRAQEAVGLLEPYAARDEPPLDVLTTRGVAFARLGRSREALASFERARRIDASNPMTLVQIATVHLAAGDAKRARASLEEALRINPDVALAHHHLGLLAAARGDQAEAERRFRRALDLDPGDADSLLNLGNLLIRLGRTDEARPVFERFLREAPPAIYAQQIRQVEAWLGHSRRGSG